jgi:DNA-binding GntR family transcriptional regulator
VDKAVREVKTGIGGVARLSALQEPQVSLRSRIIEALRRAIESGVLEPGARLVERELCEQLKVSRTSLREALGELQAEGILTYSPTRRLSVSVISQADAENAYRIRGTLEALVVEQFIEKASEDDVAALIEQGEHLKAAYRSGDVDRMLVAKRAFYDGICSGADNAIAFDIINRCSGRSARRKASRKSTSFSPPSHGATSRRRARRRCRTSPIRRSRRCMPMRPRRHSCPGGYPPLDELIFSVQSAASGP